MRRAPRAPVAVDCMLAPPGGKHAHRCRAETRPDAINEDGVSNDAQGAVLFASNDVLSKLDRTESLREQLVAVREAGKST